LKVRQNISLPRELTRLGPALATPSHM
jgi:hypothetical protein